MYVEYNGKPVNFFICDNYAFRGSGDDVFDEYSVCVTPLHFNDSNCAVELNFKASIIGVTKHVSVFFLVNVCSSDSCNVT